MIIVLRYSFLLLRKREEFFSDAEIKKMHKKTTRNFPGGLKYIMLKDA